MYKSIGYMYKSISYMYKIIVYMCKIIGYMYKIIGYMYKIIGDIPRSRGLDYERIAVARNQRLRQQDIRNCCGQLVCVGEWWAASLLFVRVLYGVFSKFVYRGPSGVKVSMNTATSKGAHPSCLAPPILDTRMQWVKLH